MAYCENDYPTTPVEFLLYTTEDSVLLSLLGRPHRRLRGRMVCSLVHCNGPLSDECRHIQAANTKLAALNRLKYSVYISRGAGLVLTFDGTLIILPMCRNLIRLLRPRIRWLPLEETAWFHRQTAYALLLFVILHVAAHYVK